MNTALSVWLMVACLVVGIFGGALAFPVEKIVEVEVPVNVTQIVEVPAECDEVTALDLREIAFEDFWAYLDDEDEFVCDGVTYDEDEVSLSKIYDKFSIDYNDEKYTVEFSARLKFKESDFRTCRDTFDVSVHYKPDKEPEITIE